MATNLPIDIFQAAKYLCKESGWALTHLEIQKLLYIVYMFYWGDEHKALFSGHFQAWDLGPVNPEVYRKLKRFGKKPITKSAFRFTQDLEAEDDIIDLLDEALEVYPPNSSVELVAYTHRPGTAWYKKYRTGIKSIIITNDDIQEEYENHKNGVI